ncbi:hypothetical protein RJ639_035911 [Escallonia herrerae]|uniref:Plastid lipid-associated protein/fibrillin conserved domain-containing protein n=1 Tax=Escallonia herrerae TaxID=1293975 RepID=A0AA88WSB9_9ASTE|nr:hypothetical protein RJ639_035911 [Escallonia herrerae]
MATKLVQPPIPAPHLAPPSPNMSKMMKTPRALSATHHRFGHYPSGYRPVSTVKVAEESCGLIEDNPDIAREESRVEQIKADLYEALQGINRGIFGVPSAKKSEIEDLVKLLESQNPLPDPTSHLEKVGGCWKLVYSTITILGSKRTKLGLRDFITLGDSLQIIDVAEGKAVNVIKFNARGLNLFNGQLTIEASFKIASKSVKDSTSVTPFSQDFHCNILTSFLFHLSYASILQRVDISYNSSTITPEQLMNLFRKNYDLLLGIFNPEGWLEITYVDASYRIGRDDKGNIFILERS